MNDGIVPDIDGHMEDIIPALVKDQVARLQVFFLDRRPVGGLRVGKMRQRETVFGIDEHGEARAVTALRQTFASPDVRRSHKLSRIADQVIAKRRRNVDRVIAKRRNL